MYTCEQATKNSHACCWLEIPIANKFIWWLLKFQIQMRSQRLHWRSVQPRMGLNHKFNLIWHSFIILLVWVMNWKKNQKFRTKWATKRRRKKRRERRQKRRARKEEDPHGRLRRGTHSAERNCPALARFSRYCNWMRNLGNTSTAGCGVKIGKWTSCASWVADRWWLNGGREWWCGIMWSGCCTVGDSAEASWIPIEAIVMRGMTAWGAHCGWVDVDFGTTWRHCWLVVISGGDH